MKKNLKFIALIVCAIIISGCWNKLTPSEKVEDMMDKYVKNDVTLLNELDSYISKQDLSNSQKERYKKIIKDEYANIKYEIKDEKIEEEYATVTVEIEVKDLYKASKTASEYLISNPEEFYDEGVYNQDRFVDYKLSKMEEETDTISYTIYFELKNDDDAWTILELDNETLEKIHGIYDYDEK